MEESEALSNRLGIMVGGQFKCLGSVQHLKSRYGKGYSLILKCKTGSINQVKVVEEFVTKNIVSAYLTDKQQETLFYQIYSENKSSIQTIAELFGIVEANQDALCLETYSLSQTSLEQVCLSFARQKSEEGQGQLQVPQPAMQLQLSEKNNKVYPSVRTFQSTAF
jgi:ATP-binding cassette subfamily A (ABC1) protein 12